MGTGIGKAIQALTSFSPRHRLNHGGRGQINFIDVGSVGALPDPWFANQDAIRFLLNFELKDPVKRSAHSLTPDTALWERAEERPFYVYEGFSSSGSSLFEQNIDYGRQNCDTLKQRGADALLRGPCIGLHMELFTLPLYKGITPMPEVQAHCEALGYRLVKPFPPHGSFDSQHDCLFPSEGADTAEGAHPADLRPVNGAPQHALRISRPA